MRAIVYSGGIRYVRDYPRPRPSGDEALVRVAFAGVCATDLEITRGYMGFKGVLGHEFTGVVEECATTGLIGKRVVGEINLGCGRCAYCRGNKQNHCPERRVLGILNKDGVFADYTVIPVKNLHILPDSIPDEVAVFTEPLAAAFEILEQLALTPDKNICVLGDGRLGLLTAQVLSKTGSKLIACGRHMEKLSILDKIGIRTRLGTDGLGRDFDVAVDCTGSPSGFEAALKILKPEGTLVLKTTVADRGEVDLNRLVIDEITVVGSRCGPFRPAIEALAKKTVDVKPLVSKVFTIEEGVTALEYAGRKGVLKVILRMG